MALNKVSVFCSPIQSNYDTGTTRLRCSKAEAEEITEETTCGIGCLKGRFLQRFANKKAYVFLYGLMGLILSAAYSYFNGTITTLEKRFKIPSRTTGIISVGNDISQLLVGAVITYYAGKGHRPRWIAFGIYTVVLFCLMNCIPHFVYGPGRDALVLTVEHGGSMVDKNATQDILEELNRQTLCQDEEGSKVKCDQEEGNIAPQIILFLAQFISGIGGSLYYTLGVAYMDDNIKKSKTPALVSLSYFIRMLGPALGYTLSSLCLKFYISPTLTPKISNTDPRWLGAWWIGWLILGTLMFLSASLLGLFPKTLPRAHMRRLQSKPKLDSEAEMPASIRDMIATFERLMKNPILMCNNFAAIFYFMGYMPYWIFMPKYIEIMYKTSASEASFVTGTVGLIFSACGILISGLVITKYKPGARPLALWNVVVGAISVVGLLSYAFLGCPTHDQKGLIEGTNELITLSECNSDCHCDYVKYSPVCAHGESFISPCHAGCRNYIAYGNGSKIFTDCSCVKNSTTDNFELPSIAHPGPCPVDCTTKFYTFLAVVCLLKFSGATGRASNFLVSVRCVAEKDKPVSMGLGLMMMSLFAFMPSPIFFGYIIDTTCLVWGKTCSGTGNCWLYNGESLRYIMNFTAAGFVFVGMLFDGGVWYFVKGLKIFDDEDELEAPDTKITKLNMTDHAANGKATEISEENTLHI
ncbi:Organic anion [Nesidiocoris tenuis]|uniref:Solute carrier organic anion transporter family member n=1 Tax=Nesidiocoris tenuis TaxID=355587 RepID=A0ABN7AL99_9HEMI|nr:Organic anion [Nesidiocoris tenuis]